VGTSSAVVFKQLQPTLETIISNKGSPLVRAAAAETLGILCFVASEDEQENRRIMTVLEKANASSQTSQLAATLLDVWTFLATTLTLSRPQRKTYFSSLISFLQNESTEVRVAAGQGIALLVSQDAPDEDSIVDDMDTLLDSLSGLDVDKRRKSKQEKSSQRTSFRDIINSLENSVEPSEIFQVRGNKFTFRGWHDMIRWGMLRKVLGSGLPAHFQQNPMLSDIFGFAQQTLDDEERKQLRASQIESSRERSKDQFELKTKRRREKTTVFEDASVEV